MAVQVNDNRVDDGTEAAPRRWRAGLNRGTGFVRYWGIASQRCISIISIARPGPFWIGVSHFGPQSRRVVALGRAPGEEIVNFGFVESHAVLAEKNRFREAQIGIVGLRGPTPDGYGANAAFLGCRLVS